MGRVVIFNIVFFLLPFAVYAAWLIATRRPANDPALWPLRTVGYLALAGAIVMVGALLFFLQVSRAPTDANYRPATIGEDGRIIPGTLE